MSESPPDPLAMPAPEPNGFVKTLNSMGYMTSSLDPFSRAFVEFAPQAPGRCLDIGAAYGIASLAALHNGAAVVANDIDERHLQILSGRTPASLRDRLTLAPGNFPDHIDFPAGSFGAVLLCRVMHFFDGPTIERAAEKLRSWLAPGGKAFVVSETPFLKTALTFFPTYQARLKAGDPWPGMVDNVGAHDPKREGTLPRRMHLLDETILRRVFSHAGFAIERLQLFARPDFPADLQLDGRESVGLIARKD